MELVNGLEEKIVIQLQDRAVFDLPEQRKRCEIWTFQCWRLVSGEDESQLFRSACMCVFPNSVRNCQLLAACSFCCTTRCIELMQLCCEPEQIKMKNTIFLFLEPIQVKYYNVMCQCRVEEAAVVLVAWGEECLGDGTGPEEWCSEATYDSLSNNRCLPLDFATDRLTLFECSPCTNGFFFTEEKVWLVLTLFEMFCEVTDVTATVVCLLL